MPPLSPPKLRFGRRAVGAGDGPREGEAGVPPLYPGEAAYEEPSGDETAFSGAICAGPDTTPEVAGFRLADLNCAESIAGDDQSPRVLPRELSGSSRDARNALLLGLGSLIPVVGLGTGPAAVWYSWRAVTRARVRHPRIFLEAVAGFLLGVICTVAQWAIFLDVFAWAFLER